MRISPNRARLRVVALSCWAIGAWCVVQGVLLLFAPSLLLSVEILGLLLLGVGMAFWLLSNDDRAGIIFDTKGLLFNLGHCSAFIAWDNIEQIGVTARRDSLFALGSRHQLGIKLRDVQQYVQTYEERLPVTRGVFGRGLQIVERALRPLHKADDRSLTQQLALCRARTGFDTLIPEMLLGGRAEAFAEILECYRRQPAQRRTLG